jgi:hypothetical protein
MRASRTHQTCASNQCIKKGPKRFRFDPFSVLRQTAAMARRFDGGRRHQRSHAGLASSIAS